MRSPTATIPRWSRRSSTLQAHAASGVPTLPELRSSFDASPITSFMPRRRPSGDGLLDQAAGNLMRLVTVRPVGADVAGESAAARVARAEAALADGDLAAAVAELEPLDGAADAAAAPWLAAGATSVSPRRRRCTLCRSARRCS